MAGNLTFTDMIVNVTTISGVFQYEDSSISPNASINGSFIETKRKPPPFQSPPLTVDEIVTLPLYSLIFILSVVGNLLVIITLIQNKRMRTVTNVFLLNLSVSDLLLAVFCMPFTIIPIMLKNFIFGSTMCVLIRYMQGKCNISL